jgi:arylformamidase
VSDDAPVFAAYSQSELNRQYDAAGTVPSVDEYFERFAAASARTRASLPKELDIAYGRGERETLDLFPAAESDAPLFIFIHGGYWRRLDKSFFSFVAGPIARAGGATAVINYPLAPGASLDEIVHSTRAALNWIAKHTNRANADPKRIFAGGHSAGGQLAGMLAEDERIQGIFPISGLFDLEPVRLSHVNEWLNLDAESAQRNSPQLHLPRRKIPLVASVGGAETDEFQRQSRSYVDAWSKLGHPAKLLAPAGHNHFSIVLEFNDEESELTEALLALLF